MWSEGVREVERLTNGDRERERETGTYINGFAPTITKMESRLHPEEPVCVGVRPPDTIESFLSHSSSSQATTNNTHQSVTNINQEENKRERERQREKEREREKERKKENDNSLEEDWWTLPVKGTFSPSRTGYRARARARSFNDPYARQGSDKSDRNRYKDRDRDSSNSNSNRVSGGVSKGDREVKEGKRSVQARQVARTRILQEQRIQQLAARSKTLQEEVKNEEIERDNRDNNDLW